MEHIINLDENIFLKNYREEQLSLAKNMTSQMESTLKRIEIPKVSDLFMNSGIKNSMLQEYSALDMASQFETDRIKNMGSYFKSIEIPRVSDLLGNLGIKDNILEEYKMMTKVPISISELGLTNSIFEEQLSLARISSEFEIDKIKSIASSLESMKIATVSGLFNNLGIKDSMLEQYKSLGLANSILQEQSSLAKIALQFEKSMINGFHDINSSSDFNHLINEMSLSINKQPFNVINLDYEIENSNIIESDIKDSQIFMEYFNSLPILVQPFILFFLYKFLFL